MAFRAVDPAGIIRLAVNSGLQAIEWGGDVHVPQGDFDRARKVRQLTADAGIETVSYGSYWRAGVSSGFDEVVKTASALGAPLVRVWAGATDGRRAQPDIRAAVIAELRQAADIAQDHGIRLSLEFHDDTLACTGLLTRILLEEVAHAALRCHWQPPLGESDEVCRDSLRLVQPWLTHLHVFHWWPTACDKKPLALGADRWQSFLSEIANDGFRRATLLEFLPDGNPASLAGESAALHAILSSAEDQALGPGKSA